MQLLNWSEREIENKVTRFDGFFLHCFNRSYIITNQEYSLNFFFSLKRNFDS